MATRIGAEQVRRDYRLSCADPAEINADFDLAGFVRMPPAAVEEGDILLVRVGPAQLHVVVLTGDGYLHADAGLRRVVEVPGALPWPILSAWRWRMMFPCLQLLQD